MFVKKFEEYVSTVYEHFDMSTVKLQNKTKTEIYNGFKNLGYKYIGNFYWTTKTYDNFISEPVKKFLSNYLEPLEKEVFGKIISHLGELNVSYYPKSYESDEKKFQFVIDCISNNVSNERVVRIKEKGNNFYCFWNPTEKYYYYMSFGSKQNVYSNRYGITIYNRDFSGIEGIFNNYISLKTESIDEVKKKFNDIKLKLDEEERERELKRQEREKRKEIESQIRKIKSDIYKDYKENPKKYKEVNRYEDIPQEIRDDLNSKNYEDCEYFADTRSGSYYDNEGRGARVDTTTYYINNRELTDGYVYTTTYRDNWTGD